MPEANRRVLPAVAGRGKNGQGEKPAPLTDGATVEKSATLRKGALLLKEATPEQKQVLFKAFARLKTPEDIEALLLDLCTTREINELAQRLGIAELLNQGNYYLEIQEETGASATTIARVSKCLAHGSGGYRKVIARMAERDEPSDKREVD